MTAVAISYLCMICEAVILFRALRGRFYGRFPIFFSYIGFVLLQSMVRGVVRSEYPQNYAATYWCTEFLGVFAGSAIVFEFYKVALAGFPGVAKLARNALLFVSSLAVGKVILTAAQGSSGWSGSLTIQLERDMRFVQIAAVAALVSLFAVYSIPAGRNLLGIVVGYGLYLGISVVNLTYLDHFREAVLTFARMTQSVSYLLALVLWTLALWSDHSVVSPSADVVNLGYPTLRAGTAKKLAGTRVAVQNALDS